MRGKREVVVSVQETRDACLIAVIRIEEVACLDRWMTGKILAE